MAKARSGLGRGFDSLFGNTPPNLNSQENVETPAEEKGTQEKTKEEETAKKVSQAPTAPAVVAPVKPAEEKSEEKAKPVEAEKNAEKTEELYSNKEDNITIKGVVERVVEPAAPTTVLKAEHKPIGQAEVRNDLEIDINLVEPNPEQPRISFKKEDLEELASSIKKNGLLQPLLVRKVGDKYQIIAGERRWQACKQLGMKKVPVRLKDADDDQTIILALIENIQRSDLNPIEEAYGYRRMMERGKMTQSEVAQAVSKGRSTIANALRLLELPEDAQQLLFEEKITAGHARAILSIPTKEGRTKLTDKLMEQNLTVREAEAMARLLSGVKKEPAQRTQQPKSYKTVARALRDTLETDVKIKSSGGKNKIEIAFKDETDLERLFRTIAGE